MRSVVKRNAVIRRMTVFSRTSDLIVTVRWVRRSVLRLSSWRHIFVPRPGNVRFVVDKVAVGQIFLPVLLFPPDSIIPPVLHTHLYQHVALNQKDKRTKPGNLQKSMLFLMSRCLRPLILTSVTMVTAPSLNSNCSHGHRTLLLTAIRCVHPIFSNCTSYLLHGSLPPCDASTCDKVFHGHVSCGWTWLTVCLSHSPVLY